MGWKTYCRFCDITVLGLYLNCPRCGKYLPPVGEGDDVSPEPFQLVKLGESWQSTPKEHDDLSARTLVGRL